MHMLSFSCCQKQAAFLHQAVVSQASLEQYRLGLATKIAALP